MGSEEVKGLDVEASRGSARTVGVSLPPLVEAMLDPGFYPHRPETVELRQTHISFVFIAGAEVYKVKKPVRFTFLDFTRLEQRRHYCAEEVRLNRRLAPDVYLGVVGLKREKGEWGLTAEDDPAAEEYAVRMRRLPDDRTLDRMLQRGAVPGEAIERLAALLVDFHRRAERSDEITANGAPAAIQRVLEDNYAGSAPFHGITIAAEDDERIQNFARSFLEKNGETFRRRMAEKRICDGHADLHADHIYLTEPPVIVDCVEFSPTFRWCDVASDLAFLAMDLDHHGRADLRELLVTRYAELAADPGLARLVPFYACYRAYVRGKVDSLKSAESEIGEEERERARQSARRHFALALRYTWAYSPALAVVCGLSGSGKSHLAQALVDRTGFTLIGSDAVRKEIAGIEPTARLQGAAHARLYSPQMSERTYDELFARARRELASGRGVVLDATFQLRRGRDQARQVAAAAGVPFALVECVAADSLVRERLAERNRRGKDPSDADWSVYQRQQRNREPFAAEEGRMVADTSGEIEKVLRMIEARIVA